jgi:uncharacterized membrane protein
MASEISSDLTLKVNDDFVDSKTIGITAGETLDLQVAFKAITDESDVRVKAWIEGYRDEIEAETQRFDVITNRTYTKRLSLAIPLDLDIKEDYKLIIRIASKNKEDQQSYQLTIQRPSYDIEVLSTEFVREVKDGDNLQINVVVKNRGSHKVEDAYIKASIPELGVEKRVYAGDLVAVDCEECDKEDAVEKTLVLEIPKGTKSGTYDLSIEAYNDDSSYTVEREITVKGAEAEQKVEVLTPQLTKEVQVGGKEIYKIEIVNPTDETKIITITTPSALEKAGFKITATPSVVTIPANSAESVEVTVEATNETATGTYTVPIQVGTDETVKEVGITANVVKVKAQPSGLRRPLFTLAVVLGILFVVLVIVLFTTMKKPEKAGEEETAYY